MKKYLVSIFTLIMPYIVFAEEAGAEHHGPDFMGLVWRLIVFVVFAVILVKVLKKPASDFLTNKTDEVKKAIEDAERAKSEAEAELNSYKTKLAEMNKELEEMKERAIKSAEIEKQRIIEDADKNIEKLKSFAESMIESDLNKAKDELRKETFMLALKLAEEKLGSSISEANQSALMKEYIKRIGAIN